jgi:hypothetical protein
MSARLMMTPNSAQGAKNRIVTITGILLHMTFCDSLSTHTLCMLAWDNAYVPWQHELSLL